VYGHVGSVLFPIAFFRIATLTGEEKEEDPLPVEAIEKGQVRVADWLGFVLVRLSENEENGFQFYIGNQVDGTTRVKG